MSTFAIAELAASPFVDNIIAQIGRKRCFVLGIMLNAISCIVFGFASYSSSATVYFYVSVFARAMSGVGDAIMLICTPVMIVTQYPDKKEIYMGYFVMMMSQGLLIGPIIGAYVYGILGYSYTFYAFSIFLFLSAILA